MATTTHPYRLGIICCLPAAYDAQCRLVCNHSIGRLLDVMRAMVPGARRLAPRHLSIRVPWHDAAWNGAVCAAPSQIQTDAWE